MPLSVVRNLIFQHDEAPLYYTRNVRQFLDDHFNCWNYSSIVLKNNISYYKSQSIDLANIRPIFYLNILKLFKCLKGFAFNVQTLNLEVHKNKIQLIGVSILIGVY